MRSIGLISRTRRPSREFQQPPIIFVSDNTLNRHFKVERLNQVWVSDFTCLKFNHGKSKIWLSTIIDLYSHENIAWTICQGPTAQDAIKTFNFAIKKFPDAQPLIHTD